MMAYKEGWREEEIDRKDMRSERKVDEREIEMIDAM